LALVGAQWPAAAIYGVVAGIMLAGIGLLATLIAKDSFTVAVQSTSGTVDALKSADEAYVTSIVNAMNEAFIRRG
jgi:hypothetical protein